MLLLRKALFEYREEVDIAVDPSKQANHSCHAATFFDLQEICDFWAHSIP